MNNITLANALRERWSNYVSQLEYSPLFVTVSGAHLYGFSSPDSDIDLRGCHQLPLEQVIGLYPPRGTFQLEVIHEGTEVDLVSHEIGKYFALLVKNNGYILEQVYSPLVISGERFLNRLREHANRCITRNHYFHYRGFFNTQLKLIEKSSTKTVKSILYAYRVLLTGIHLMQTGKVEANLLTLNEKIELPGISELIASKVQEKSAFTSDWSHHRTRLQLLEKQLEKSYLNSDLPEKADREAVNQFLIQQRLQSRD